MSVIVLLRNILLKDAPVGLLKCLCNDLLQQTVIDPFLFSIEAFEIVEAFLSQNQIADSQADTN